MTSVTSWLRTLVGLSSMVDISSTILSLPEKLPSKMVNCILLLLLSGSSAVSMYLCGSVEGGWGEGG